MNGKQKTLVALGILFFACVVIWAVRTVPEAPKVDHSNDDQPRIMTYDNNTISEEKDGVKIWDLTADHLEVDIDSRNAEMTGITGHFYQKDGRSAEVTADHGSYDNETKNIQIDGNVKITTSDGATLTSDELLWTAEQGMLSAIGQAKVSNDTIRAWGERIDSTDGFNKIKISGKAHIEKLVEGAEQQ